MNEQGPLSIVIPAYNEASRIGPTVSRIAAWADERALPVELIVVDDGSDDGTATVASAAAPRARVLSNGRNRGKGYSVAHGVSASNGSSVLFTDADLSTPIEEYDKLAVALRTVDIAIGSRGLAESDIRQRQPLYRQTMGRIFNRVVQTLAVRGIRDTQCGFKLFRGDVARRIFQRVTTDGFAFDVEALMIARSLGYTIAEVPVVWINDERTRVHPVFDSLRMLRDVARLRLTHSTRSEDRR